MTDKMKSLLFSVFAVVAALLVVANSALGQEEVTTQAVYTVTTGIATTTTTTGSALDANNSTPDGWRQKLDWIKRGLTSLYNSGSCDK